MSNSGLPSTTMMSASLPGSIVPVSRSPSTSAATFVADEIASISVIPMSTSADTSRHADSAWKLSGEPVSVPIAMRASASMNWRAARSLFRICRGVLRKYGFRQKSSFVYELNTCSRIGGGKLLMISGSHSRSGNSSVAG